MFVTGKGGLSGMVKQGSGVVVTVGSIGGLRCRGHDHVGCCASKAGRVQFTRQIAARYAPHDIRCNTVIPGMIDTPLLERRVSRQKGRADLATLRNEAKTRVPSGRRGDAWDVAWDVACAARFLRLGRGEVCHRNGDPGRGRADGAKRLTPGLT